MEVKTNRSSNGRKISQSSEMKVNFFDEKCAAATPNVLKCLERNNNDYIDQVKGVALIHLQTTNEFDVSSIITEPTPNANSNNNKKKKCVIPDGGYGWTVVFASLVIQLIIDGISFSFGLIYTELLNYFEESKTKTAWIGALVLAVPLMSGPVISNLVDKYGCRKMTIIGGLIGGIGFVLASISTSVEMLYITFGLISGFGIGIGYVTGIVAIAFWFDKKRTLATSLGATGTGIGTFVYAPLTQWLIETFGWRGATLILGGTLFNVCICGCLMRDPDWLIEENRLESRSQSVLTVSNSSMCLDEIRKMLETGTPGETVLDTLMTNVNTEVNQQTFDSNKANVYKKYCSESILPTYLSSSEFRSDAVYNLGSRRSLRVTEPNKNPVFAITGNQSTPKSRYLASAETLNASENYSHYDIDNASNDFSGAVNGGASLSQKWSSRLSLDESLIGSHHKNTIYIDDRQKKRGCSLGSLLETDNPDEKLPNPDITLIVPLIDYNEANGQIIAPNGLTRRRHHNRHPHNNGEIVSNLRRSVPLRHSHHLQHMRVHRHGMNYRGAMLNTHRYRLKASSCPNIYRNSITTLAKEEEDTWYDNFIDLIKSIFDFSMFLEPKFFIFNLSTLLLFIWFIVPYFYITDHLLKYNYKEEDGANLISVIGIFSTVGMIILGYIGDKPWVNISKTYATCLVVCGISTALMPLCVYNYNYLLVLGAIFGITFSSSFSFIPILLVELVELEDFTCAYGLVLLVQGIGNLIGPPLAGIIYEYTDRWDDAFYAAGVFIVISGVLAWIAGVMVARDDVSDEDDDT